MWPPGTPGVLVVAGPHAIPVSTAVRAGDRRLLFALARSRETLDRLRDDPGAALALLAEGVAFTAYGEAGVVRESLQRAPTVAALELHVERVQDHLAASRAEILGGVQWRWGEESAGAADAAVMAELEELAREG
jgi:hypothetical protein